MLIICQKTFCELLTSLMSESLMLFDQEFYKQHDEVAMGSPLEPTPGLEISTFYGYNVGSMLNRFRSTYF